MIASKKRQRYMGAFLVVWWGYLPFLTSGAIHFLRGGGCDRKAQRKGKRKDFLNEVVQIDKEKRVEWHQIRAEYINGVSQRKLAEKYGLSRTIVADHCKREKWSEAREQAKASITQKIIQKTAEKVADNATLAADIKRKGLLLLNKLFDDYMQYTVTEHRESKEPGTVDVKRLRDLTAAYKDLTEDIQAGSNATNELLQSLLDIERRTAT